MATKRKPVPRAWEQARRQSVQHALEIIALFSPKRLDFRKLSPELKDAIYLAVHYAHAIVDQLTSVPAEDERNET